MIQIMKTRLFLPFVLMLLMSAFLFTGTSTYTAAQETDTLPILSVDNVWLTGDTIHITITDTENGQSQIIEMSLSDYAKTSDEFITVQAISKDGRTSNAIQFKNPNYVPSESPSPEVPTAENISSALESSTDASAVPDGNPERDEPSFTPDGEGTVIDNMTDKDGKEFFSINTEDGNTFYLIIDRARDTDNVYLLNAVTETDLASLAKEGDGKISAVPEITTASPETVPTEIPPEAVPEPATTDGSNSSIIFIAVAVIAVGGVGYYLKIVRPKKHQDIDDFDDMSEFDDDTETDLENDGEDEDI